jgi:TRAP-type uncharacterized transport system substrate-binding protein
MIDDALRREPGLAEPCGEPCLRYRPCMSPDRPKQPPHLALRELIIGAGPVVITLLLAGVVGLLVLAYRVLDPTPDKHLVMATGPEQGAYGEFAKRYVALLREHGVTLELRPTQGTRDNLALLRDAGSGVQVALVQGGVDDPRKLSSGPSPRVPLMSLGNVAYEPLWLFYREDSARQKLRGVPLTRLGQLQGWRINTGPSGGGSGPMFHQLAEANRLLATELELGNKPAVHGVADLVQGRIDAVAMVSAAEAPLVQYLLRTPGVRLFDVQQSEAYARRFPFLRALILPRGVVDLAGDQPPADVHLVAATASLVAHEELHPALVQLLLQAARQVHGSAGWFAASNEFPNAGTSEFPLSPEAERFFRNGPPWLQRYLPFWLANFIDRMWFVLLPLLGLLLPLSRLLPPLVELRVRSKVFRWYAHLREVERAIEQPGAGAQRALDELARIEAQVEHIGMPLSYTHELYTLRSHIQLVRRRALARDAGSPALETPAT